MSSLLRYAMVQTVKWPIYKPYHSKQSRQQGHVIEQRRRRSSGRIAYHCESEQGDPESKVTAL